MVVGPLAVLASLTLGFDPVQYAATQPLVHRLEGHVGAATCVACHPDQHASWAQSWHATMTQRASTETVQGAFDGRIVHLYGESARPYTEGGRFYMDMPERNGGRRTAEVVLAVGSHRYQQYFEEVSLGKGATFRRLQLLWSIAEKRWLHINGVFLDPDGLDWHTEPAIWNENCIFCHNTGPRPHFLNWKEQPEGHLKEFDSQVADLGIACESCHGPGAEHVAAFADPSQRYLSYLGDDFDRRVVNPLMLDKERAVAVCGQCHGQRLPKRVELVRDYLDTGPTYRSGDRLEDHVALVSKDSKFVGQKDIFALRFWKDGTPRLSAYEYQGVVASPCYIRGEMTCFSCHSGHQGSRDAMMKKGMRGNQACTQCHVEIGSDVRAHTGHDPAGSGSKCLECHMPRIAYGLRTALRSHKIESPDPARDAAAERPNACTMCHLDKSPIWAATEMRRMFGERYVAPTAHRVPSTLDMSDALVSLLSGDPVQRVVYAVAASQPGAAVTARGRDAMRLALIATLGDAYATVRNAARHSLIRLEKRHPVGIADQLRRYDPMATTVEQRATLVRSMLASVAQKSNFSQSDVGGMIRLLAQQPETPISIGR